jgi:hypothetical protein
MLFWALKYSFGNILTLKYFDQPQRDQSGFSSDPWHVKKRSKRFFEGKTTSKLHKL